MPIGTRRRYVRRKPAVRRRMRAAVRKRRVYASRATPVRLSRATGFAKSMLVRLRYCDMLNKAVSISTTPFDNSAYHIFQTSLYDPDLTGSGHQPLYFDQLCSSSGPYTRYRVYGIGYHIWAMNTNTSQIMPMVVLHSAQQADLHSLPWSQIEEQPGARVVNIGPSGARPTYVKGYMSIAKTLGLSKSDIRTEDDFEAAYNSTPVRSAFLHLYVSSGNVSTGNNCQIRVKLTLYAELSCLATQNQS